MYDDVSYYFLICPYNNSHMNSIKNILLLLKKSLNFINNLKNVENYKWFLVLIKKISYKSTYI